MVLYLFNMAICVHELPLINIYFIDSFYDLGSFQLQQKFINTSFGVKMPDIWSPCILR